MVVGAGVDDRVLRMGGDRVPGAVSLDEPAADDAHREQAEIGPDAVDRRRDDPEVLGDQRELPELCLDRSKQRGPRTAVPASLPRIGRPCRDCPVGDETTEVIDSRDVDELERPAEAFDPPAVTLTAVLAPVVDGLAPELPGGMRHVRGGSGDEPVREELRVGPHVGPVGRDVDGNVSDQKDAALGGIRPEGEPLAFEANLVFDRAGALIALPVAHPVGVPRPESLHLGGRHLGIGIGQQPWPGREGRRGRVGRAEGVWGTEWEHLPPALAGELEPVDELVCLPPQPPTREGGDVEQDAARAPRPRCLPDAPHRPANSTRRGGLPGSSALYASGDPLS